MNLETSKIDGLNDRVEDEKVVINASGRRFETTRSSLNEHPKTLLGSSALDSFYNRDSGEYVFKRDPDSFQRILNYYHTGKLHLPKNECVASFEDDLSFFGILPCVISKCCYEEYLDKKREFAQHDKPSTEHPTSIREKMWECLAKPRSSTVARLIDVFMNLIVLSLILTSIDEDSYTQHRDSKHYRIYIIAVESLLRLIAAPHRTKSVFIISLIIDILIVLSYFYLYISMVKLLFITCLVLRAARVLQSLSGLKVFGESFKNGASELSTLILPLLFFATIFSIMLFIQEKGAHEYSNIHSIFDALWYSIITMTTVGFGDVVAHTMIGKMITVACALSGIILVFVLPISIVVSNYSRISNKNRRGEGREEHSEPQDLNSVEMS